MTLKKLIICLAFSTHLVQVQAQTSYVDVTQTHLNVRGLDRNTMDAAVSDIDNDGDPDIILAIEFGKNMLLINDGTGRFTQAGPQQFPSTAHDSEDIAAEDLDGDGDTDIVFVSEDDRVNEYYLNLGNGYFTDVSERLGVEGVTNAIEAGDLDGDGDLDLVLGNAGQNYYLANDGKGNFRDETRARLPSDQSITQDIAIGDMDGDGDPDLVIGNETTNQVWLNDGKGVFTMDPKRLPDINDQTREVDLGDIDNDGDLDLVFANVDFGGFGNPQNRLLRNDGKGFFEEITGSLPASKFRTVDIDFFDIDGDGDLDLLSGNRFNGNEKLVLINERGKFTDKTGDFFPSMDLYVFDFQVADFNMDGIDDIYLCAFRGQDKLLFGKK